MTCEELEHGYELYLLGTLEAEERAELEAHLARGCPACTAGVAQARAVALHLGLAAPPAEPPVGLRARILDAVGAREPSRARGRLWKWAFAATALAALALVVLSAGLSREVGMLGQEIEALRVRAAEQRHVERGLIEQLNLYRQALRTITGPEVREVRFGAGPPSGRIFVAPRGLVMIVSNFPPPPPGRTYELWLIAANRPAPVPAGLFKPDASGNAIHVWPQPVEMAALKAFAISDEPPGGVPAPTGKILVTAPVR